MVPTAFVTAPCRPVYHKDPCVCVCTCRAAVRQAPTGAAAHMRTRACGYASVRPCMHASMCLCVRTSPVNDVEKTSPVPTTRLCVGWHGMASHGMSWGVLGQVHMCGTCPLPERSDPAQSPVCERQKKTPLDKTRSSHKQTRRQCINNTTEQVVDNPAQAAVVFAQMFRFPLEFGSRIFWFEATGIRKSMTQPSWSLSGVFNHVCRHVRGYAYRHAPAFATHHWKALSRRFQRVPCLYRCMEVPESDEDPKINSCLKPLASGRDNALGELWPQLLKLLRQEVNCCQQLWQRC